MITSASVSSFVEDEEFIDFLKHLARRLDGPSLGITKLVIDGRFLRLSPKQRWIFENHVVGEFVLAECALCSCNIPWSEMDHAIDNGGYCNYCWHKMEKVNDE